MVDTSQGAIYSVLDHIYSTIMKDDGKTAAPTGLIVSIMNQGMSIDPWDYLYPWTPYFGTGQDSDIATREPEKQEGKRHPERSLKNTIDLVDKKLVANPKYEVMRGTSSISQTWQAIINGATIDPDGVANVDMEAFERYQKVLWEEKDVEEEDMRTGKMKTVKGVKVPTTLFKNYQDQEKKYYDAYTAYVSAYQQRNMTTWNATSRPLQAAVDLALAEWNQTRSQVKQALDGISSIGVDPSGNMIADAKKKWDLYQASTGGIFAISQPYTELQPSYWCRADNDEGWMEYTGTFKKTDTYKNEKTAEWHAEAELDFGLFSIADGETKASMKEINEEISQEDTTISLKYMLVTISRPWLDTSLFSMKNWYLVGAKKHSIANGEEPEPNNPENWFLPSIPTQMIVVKDLVIKNSALQKHFNSVKSSLETNASLSYGPFFTADGDGSQTRDTEIETEDKRDEGLEFKGIQIIGWVSEVMPAAPKMDAPQPG